MSSSDKAILATCVITFIRELVTQMELSREPCHGIISYEQKDDVFKIFVDV